ncbi:MAG: hypothetical protein GC166_04905 [Alphaproteobacteria bacterium]|nr:hypothetical protein [Alphaproteobacteria bacterium]
MTGIWKTWMRLWCAGALLFALVLVTVAVPGLSGPMHAVFGIIAPGSDTALLDMPIAQFGLGLQGALTIGWIFCVYGVLIAGGAHNGALWRWQMAGVVAWYIIDSAISVITGFPINAVSNTLLMVLFAVPVVASGAMRTRAG